MVNVVSNHKARYNNDRDIEIYGRMEPGDRSDDPKLQILCHMPEEMVFLKINILNLKMTRFAKQ